MDVIKEQQDADDELQNQGTKYADHYICKSVSAVDNVLCYFKPALPRSMLQPTICWFHVIIGHSGSKCLHMQISSQYYHQDLQNLIDKYYCDHCQCNKLDGKEDGHLHKCEIYSMPFEECAVNLIGSWMIQV